MRVYTSNDKIDDDLFLSRGLVEEVQQEPNVNSEKGIVVDSLSVNGLSKVRSGVLNGVIDGVLRAKTIHELALEANQAAARLKQLDIAEDVEVFIYNSSSGHNYKSGAVGTEVLFECQDKKRKMIRTGTSISQGHIKGGLFGKIRNVFGGGEYLEASYSVGNRNGTAIQGRFTTPINGNPFRLFDLNVFQDSNDFTQSSSYREVARGINLSLKKIGIGKNHEFNYTYSWRNICDLGNKASQSIREEAGNHVKSSLSYLYSRDTISLHPEPSGGHLFKLFTEYAGFGGVNFHKTQLDSALELPLGRGWYVDLIARGGLAIPIRNSKIGISDRFFLGGSTSLRGYQYRGVGPMDHKDSLGGNIFGALSLTLLGPVPSVETKRLKSQLWINGGQLALWENNKPSMELVKRSFSRPSVSTGVGLLYQFGAIRLELNYCLPISVTSTDKLNPGFQFGLGINYGQ